MRPRALFVLLAALAAGLPSQALAAVVQRGQVVMGTVLTVTVVAGDSGAAGALADAAVAEARSWDDALTVWREDGELARLNARAGTGPVPVGPRLARGLAAMLDLATRTRGAFDPAVGVLTQGRNPGATPPPLREVLALHGSAATLAKGGLLDPGAIGKGLAIDAMMELLRQRGATAAFLDFGGSSQAALGAPPGDSEGWGVLVSGLSEGTSHGTVRLRDSSLSTSRAGAVDTSPILDPRTGRSIPGPRLATVLAASATDADAWSTAMVVLGREAFADARADGIEVLLEDAGGPAKTAGFPVPPGRGWGSPAPVDNESQLP